MSHYLKQVSPSDIEYLLGLGVLKHTTTFNKPLDLKVQATDSGWLVWVPTDPPLSLTADRLCVSLKTGISFKPDGAEATFPGFVYTQAHLDGLTSVYITDILFV